MMILKNIGVDWRDRRLIWHLYQRQSASMQIGNNLTSACQIGAGVRQGRSLSPLLFVIHDEAMASKATENCEHKNKLRGDIMSIIRYADDEAVIASSEKIRKS